MSRFFLVFLGVVCVVAEVVAEDNRIVDSTRSLAPFFEKLRSGERVTVLHIGDSHVQAGFFTGRVRELFGRDFGSAGRGLVVPYKLAGMNEPVDYAVRAGSKFSAVKAGPTMVEVTFEVPYYEFGVWSREPFSAVTVLHSEGAPMLTEPDSLGLGVYCWANNTPESTYIPLEGRVDSLVLRGLVGGGNGAPVYRGFVLHGGEGGVMYHSVGLNGAAFEAFGDVARGTLRVLEPDLVIVSLGTNNCFGSGFREDLFRGVVDGFVCAMKEGYGVPILLTTPMEACRRVRGWWSPNGNIAVAAGIICDAARESGVAYWDFYGAAGGEGAMARWYAEGCAARDHIHLTEKGYERQGDMLYEALMNWE